MESKKMSDIRLSSIVAMSENRVIGVDNTLPWHIPEDLKHFKRVTMGKPIIMGRKSYESLGKPLPGRANIVVSRSLQSLDMQPTTHFTAMESVARDDLNQQTEEGPFLYSSIEEAINAARQVAQDKGLDEVFITGGGKIYEQTLADTQRLYLTLVHKDIEGDTYFPAFDWDEWSIISEEKHDGSSNDGPAFTFFTLERKRTQGTQ